MQVVGMLVVGLDESVCALGIGHVAGDCDDVDRSRRT